MEVALGTTHVEKMKEIVIMMTNARMVTNVKMITAEVHLVSILNLTAATVKRMIFVHLKMPAV